MLLKKLIQNVEIVKTSGDLDKEIEFVTINTKEIVKNSLFICISGGNYDSHNAVKEIGSFGGTAIICERELNTELTQIIVKDSRKAMGIIASNFYSRPQDKLKIIGVSGTNGKTTTTHIIAEILNNAGKKCGVIGTLGSFYVGNYTEPTLTTPDPLNLYKLLYEMVKSGIEYVAMEVSAHAIDLSKIEGLKFEVGVFTNFSQDHLDYFGDMENYKRAKLKFFDKKYCKYIVTNSDDEVGLKILNSCNRAISYGIENPADIFAIDIKERVNGTEFVINLFDSIYEVNIPLIGIFNVYNALAAAVCTSLLGVTTEKTIEGLEKINVVSGRLEYSGTHNDGSIFIDYAHTPDGLEKTLTALKKITENRLICIFGCGGNRDKGKREIMGEIAGKIADFTIITSDNPRFEDPMDIICGIEKGILKSEGKYVVIEDRKSATEYGVDMLSGGDVLLIAGKGSENYQDILGVKHDYNDKETVNSILQGRYI